MHKYEMHSHTAEMGGCGKVHATEFVEKYYKGGYSGIVITDHYQPGFFYQRDGMDWKLIMDDYLKGYRAATHASKDIDFDVFLGMEIRFEENANDYLVYNITEDFLYRNERLYELGIAEFKILADENELLIFQAHPYRTHMIPMPEFVHGIEVFNGNPRHNSQNHKAMELAEQNRLLKISGSDFHQDADYMRGGMILDERVQTNSQLADMLYKQKIKLIENDGEIYDS